MTPDDADYDDEAEVSSGRTGGRCSLTTFSSAL